MSADSIIKDSIEKAQEAGLKIVRGPVYYWEGDKLVGVDCFGAVMFAHGHAKKPGFENINGKLWLNELMKILGKDRGWWSRYHYGFHQQRQLTIQVKSKDKVEHSLCGISKSSWDLSTEVNAVPVERLFR